jgi:dihydropyrimidinase
MPYTIIKGGTVVSAEGVYAADVLIEGEEIAGLVEHAQPGPDDTVIDAEGLLVLPGVVDAHTHIKLDTGIYQTADDWLTGTRTAAAGGVTTVIDFATQFPGETFTEAVHNRQREAAEAVVDYALHCMITEFPIGAELALQALVDLGVPSFKIYTTYRPNYYMEDATILRLLRKAREVGGLVIVHAENDSMVTEATQHLVNTSRTGWRFHPLGRPPIAEQEAIHRLLFLAKEANAPIYIVHCTTGRSVEMIRDAAKAGQPAWCETCPQYLLLDERVYLEAHPEHYILQPPIRPVGEPEKLWELVENRAVSVISTDSCDYTLEQKLEHEEFTKTPGGLPGIETLLRLVYTYGVAEGRIELIDMVRLLCENPSRLYGIAPQKGVLQPGSDADVVLYDPSVEGEIHAADLHYLAGYSPYEGMATKGAVRMTLSRGEVIYRDGEIIAAPGRGRFVPGKPFHAGLESE